MLLDPTIRETSDRGTPITLADLDNQRALVFCYLAACTWDKLPANALIAARRLASSSNSGPGFLASQHYKIAIFASYLSSRRAI